jgi:cell division protein FtsB
VKRRLRGLIVPLLLLIVTGYFVFNAINGSRGMTAQRRDRGLLATDTTALGAVKDRQDRWQSRVDALRHHAIARDMLNDQARSVLNLADPDDLAVPLPPPPAAPQAPPSPAPPPAAHASP